MKILQNLLKATAFVTLLALAGALASCTKRENRIYGLWDDQSGGGTLEFRADSNGKPDTLIFTFPKGKTITCKWEWVGDKYDRIRGTFTNPETKAPTTFYMDVVVANTALSIKSPLMKKEGIFKKVGH
jgi:hypothetical protein